ncbi:MAG: Maf family protein [Promethearchaeota archaeon]
MNEIILASKSIDRGELLRRCGLEFTRCITDIDEYTYKLKYSDPIQLVKALAKAKLEKAKDDLINGIFKKNKKIKEKNDKIIIAADTIVELNGEIIGKASNEEEAFKILKNLIGKTHNLITGIAITTLFKNKIVVDFDKTEVEFLGLSDEEIWAYIKTGEWRGRAGAYSIRDKASMFIKAINGSSSNVIGLPMHKIYKILKNEFDINLFKDF